MYFAAFLIIFNRVLNFVFLFTIFSKVHLTALTLTKSSSKPKYQTRQILKKANTAKSVTPLHLAASNPDPTAFFYFNGITPPHTALADDMGRLPIHFAAANPNSQILSFLLSQVDA
jgi:ankyrin repeat protein